MNPDFSKATKKAVETIDRYCPYRVDIEPLLILQQLPNVLLKPFDTTYSYVDRAYKYILLIENQDALTMVNKDETGLQYIVLYNWAVEPYKLRFALARELGHIVLQHDGSSPEEIEQEEAACYAYHLLSPESLVRKIVKIYFRPSHVSISTAFKNTRTYDSIEAMKAAIADERTRISRFTGMKNVYEPKDIEIRSLNEKDVFGGWKNYSSVVVNGKAIGFCGE